jgi:hypothetical protein
MTRFSKAGVDYFPVDVAFDDNLELLIAEFGADGLYVFIRLLQRIYGLYGYYCPFGDDERLLFSGQIGLPEKRVGDIAACAVRRGLFDPGCYEKYHILTSPGIQRRYFEIVRRRKAVETNADYLLIDADKILKNADKTEQSKAEQSKAKQSRPKYRAAWGRRRTPGPAEPADPKDYKQRAEMIDALAEADTNHLMAMAEKLEQQEACHG